MSKLGAFSQSKLGALIESKLHARGQPPQAAGQIWIGTDGAGFNVYNFRTDEYGIFYDPATGVWSYDDHPAGLTSGTPYWVNLATDGQTLWGALSDKSGITERTASGAWSVIPNPPGTTGFYRMLMAAGPGGLVALEKFGNTVYQWDGATWAAPANLQPPLVSGSAISQIGEIAVWRRADGSRGIVVYGDYPGAGFNVAAIAMDGLGGKQLWPPGPIDVRMVDSALNSAGIASSGGAVAIYIPDVATSFEIPGLPYDTSLFVWDVAAGTLTALSGKKVANRPYPIDFDGASVYVGAKSQDSGSTGLTRNPGALVALSAPTSLTQLGAGIADPSTGDAVRAIRTFSDGLTLFVGENLTSASPGATSGQSNCFAWDGSQWGPFHALTVLGNPYAIADMANP